MNINSQPVRETKIFLQEVQIIDEDGTVLFVCFDVTNLTTIRALALRACTFHRDVSRR